MQVRSRGDALYHSSIVDINKNIQNNFDPLLYITQLGKIFDIEVHAWVNTYLLWSSESEPVNSNHIYHLYPEWFEVDQNGKSDINIKIENIEKSIWEGLYLSPNHPMVNQYLLKVFKEIIINYPDLDGIHLDYIRFQDNYFGYNNEGIKTFISKNKFDPRNIHRGLFSERYGWTKDDLDSIKTLWTSFNCNNVTNLVSSLNQFIKKNNSKILISAAVKANPLEAKERWYQDWIGWLKNDLIDFAVIMNYSKSNNQFISNLYDVKESNIPRFKERVLVGISLYNQEEEGIAEKILLSELSGFNRISLFPYETIKNEVIKMEDILLNYIYKKRFIGD